MDTRLDMVEKTPFGSDHKPNFKLFDQKEELNEDLIWFDGPVPKVC